jgi:hypothetical protein
MSRIGNYLASASRNSGPVDPTIAARQQLNAQLREAMGELITRDLDGWVYCQDFARMNGKEETLVEVMRQLEALDCASDKDAENGMRMGY